MGNVLDMKTFSGRVFTVVTEFYIKVLDLGNLDNSNISSNIMEIESV